MEGGRAPARPMWCAVDALLACVARMLDKEISPMTVSCGAGILW